MRRLFALAALLCALPAHAVVLDWVTVGDPGNACDTQPQGCFGAVDYVYRIGKYEVTNAQYVEFLNAVAVTDLNALYKPDMPITRSGSAGSYTYTVVAGHGSMPVSFVTFDDAVRFANWLHNGQPNGQQDATTTEDGAYTFSDFWTVGARNPWATVFLPTEDEWYKAAYYDAASLTYFDYPAGSDTPPTCALPGTTANMANCDYAVGSPTEVGSYTGSPSPYGTFDQGGNVWEWNETIVVNSDRGLRSGAFWDTSEWIAAWRRNHLWRWTMGGSVGFRVAGPAPDCEDELDNDEDGFTDLADPGCTGVDDLSENDPTLPCDDGADNDGDGALDYPADIGCKNPSWSTESPQCSDGIDNADNDDPPLADWDGAGLGDRDPQCSAPWDKSEAPGSRACGLGAELALLLPPLTWLLRRRMQRFVPAASLTLALLLSATAIDAEVIFDTIDPTTELPAHSICSGPAVNPNWDMAFAFEVAEASDFELDFLEFRLGLGPTSAPNELRVVIHEDAGLEPGPVLEEFLLIDEMPVFSYDVPLLRIDSVTRPVLRAGNLYWVAAYAPEPEQVPFLFEVGWFARVDLLQVQATSLFRGPWGVSEGWGAQFRVAASPTACSDGADNDGDGLTDFPDDPGCGDTASTIEDPQCQDGLNNDPAQDDLIDFDGGASAGLPPEEQTNPDPQCAGKPWKDREKKTSSYPCGLGVELALLLPPLAWFHRRRGPLGSR